MLTSPPGTKKKRPQGGNEPEADTLQVLCRFRPPKKSTSGQAPKPNYWIDDDGKTAHVGPDEYTSRAFTFDTVLGSDSTQDQVFAGVENVVDSVLGGFNGTILACKFFSSFLHIICIYIFIPADGQTSAGKTHTMEGPNLRDVAQQGVIPRTIDKIFNLICRAEASTEFTVVVSYFEICK